MIPDFNIYGRLPEGIYLATLEEVKTRFVVNKHREKLFMGFIQLIDELKRIDCHLIFLDGSFVTIKDFPNDIDVCWGDWDIMNDEFLNEAIKVSPKLFLSSNKLYNCDFHPSYCKLNHNGNALYYIDFFQLTKGAESKKGIIQINF